MEAQKLKIGLTPIAGAIAAALAPSHQVLWLKIARICS